MKPSELAKFLYDSRIAAGLTQGSVSTELGYTTPQFISNWERGISAPPISIIPKLCKLYAVSEVTLFEYMVKSSLEKVEAAMREEFKAARKSK